MAPAAAVPEAAGLRPGDALLVVDLQRDFLPGGALGVAGGDAVVAVADRLLRTFSAAGLPVFLSRDWHPPDHCSFVARGGPWPPHCVAGTDGAAFAPGLPVPPQAVVISKATRPDRDAYSAFDGTGLARALQARGVTRLWLCGLATDYCVRATALDARRAGFGVVVMADGVRAVELEPGDGARALAALRGAGATVLTGPPP